MRRMIAHLLIFLTLLGNAAWALDVHAEILQGHESVLAADAGTSHEAPCLAGGSCHHCCHATAHLLGVPGATTAVVAPAGLVLGMLQDQHLRSVVPAPPFQPPRA